MQSQIEQQFPHSKTGGHAIYKTTVTVPIAPLSQLLLAFDKWMSWSPIYTFMEKVETSDQSISNSQSETAKIKRKYKTIMNKPGEYNEEELYSVKGSVKEGEFILKYRTTSYANKHVKGIESTITLQTAGEGKTAITWESQTELNLSWAEKVENLAQAVGRITYGWIGEHLDNPEVQPLKPYEHPLDELVKVQTNIYGINCLALPLHIVILSFKDKGFELINRKLLNIGGQVIAGNSSQDGSYGYADYDVQKILDPGYDMPKMVLGIPVSEVLPPKKFARMLERILEMAYLQVASLLDAHNHGQSIKKINWVKSCENLSAVYGTKQDVVLSTNLAKKVGTDEEFCQQILQGVNPLMLEWVRDLKKVPSSLHKLSITDTDGKEVSVEKLFEQKRLFLIDYEVLHDLPTKGVNKDMYFYAPYLLLYREDLPNGTNKLNIVAIQLERTENPTVYQKKTTPKNLWSLVKMFVSSADNNAHEFGYHLGLSHLAMEPVCVAVHNQLPKTHVLRSLLQPHLEETIGINFLARNTLIDSLLPFTDKTFVIGTNNGVAVASRLWHTYDFFNTSFPGQLAARGFTREREDGLTGYYYRDDGFKLWDCIGNYARNVVNTYYKQDSDVLTDKCVQAWAEEMANPAKANVKGFPTKIESKERLALCLQIIIWNGSAFHSVINYSQWPYLGFVNNRPNGLYRDVPKGLTEVDEEYLDESLAGPLPALFQILFSWLLAAPLSEDNLPCLRAMNGDINKAFQDDLQELTNFINARNKQLELEGKTPYVFCLPENVACSVSI